MLAGKSIRFLIIGVILILGFQTCRPADQPKKILVFSLTKGWRHSSIAAGQAALQKLGAQKGYRVDTTSNPRWFKDEVLASYHVVVFLNTTGNVLNRSQEAAFERYIQAGGSFLGIHSASDTEYDWPWYGNLVGAYFQNHSEIQTARIVKPDSIQDALVDGIPKGWSIEEEWYNFIPGSVSPKTQKLLFVDASSYNGSKNNPHPIAWKQEFDGGKSVYVAIGHKEETYKNIHFLRLISNAIDWLYAEKRNYTNCTTEPVPDEDRFTQTVLGSNLDEPMELAIEPGGSVWVVGRKGHIWRWNAQTQSFGLQQKLDVWTKYEDGLLGICLDRNFAHNQYVYLFYSPNVSESIQHVSRFTVRADTLDLGSEKVLLKIPVQRLECCHSGGSLTMDRQGVLWISTGDNTNPHKSDGYAPIDERPERNPFDAQKSSANTNDLRGKVLRIIPLENGTYDLPSGNLFPPGTPNCRPEIYAMGCRNPFRISVSPDGRGLAWGDVGPDAGKDSIFGPKGHDEINLTYNPGFFGWPYFIGNNFPYADRDFDKMELAGPLHDPNKESENNSPNNTGRKRVPKPMPAWVYYPYSNSEIFPQLSKGGRCAMVGPWFMGQPIAHTLPSTFKNKLLIYDWMRGWMFVASPNPAEKPVLEPVLTKFTFSKPVDVELGPDGALYVLEYGENWFAQNTDARLSRIVYAADNQAPVAEIECNQKVGGAPLTVNFSGLKSFDSDPDDSLSYEWRIPDPSHIYSRKPNCSFTFQSPGRYLARLVVTDRKGKSSVASTEILVGNYPPNVAIKLASNTSFYWPGIPIAYEADVTDKEDGSSRDGSIAQSEIQFFADFLQSNDQTQESQGHQSQSEISMGSSLILSSDCKNCHQQKVRSAGPSWLEIADRYRKDNAATNNLAKKIITGGAGNWGDHAMSAHPQLSLEDARRMVLYILSLGQNSLQNLPSQGKMVPSPSQTRATLQLTAQYRDKGAPGMESIEKKSEVKLFPPLLQAQDADAAKEAYKKNNYGKAPFYMRFYRHLAYLRFNEVDLKEVSAIGLNATANGSIPLVAEIRQDSLNSEVLGRKNIPVGSHPLDFTQTLVPLKGVRLGKRPLYVVLFAPELPQKGCDLAVEYLRFYHHREPK